MKLEIITKKEADKLVQEDKGHYLSYGYSKHYFFIRNKRIYVNRGNHYEFLKDLK